MEKEEIYKREHGITEEKPKKGKKEPTQPDDHVLAIDEKLTRLQQFANVWQKRFTKNEAVVSLCFFLSGAIFSFSINDCTGEFDVPWYAYFLAIMSVGLFLLLLITEGSLPLVTIARFAAVSIAGHISLMFLVAIDSQSWHLFTFNTCLYPFGWSELMWWFLGVMCCYIFVKLSGTRQNTR